MSQINLLGAFATISLLGVLSVSAQFDSGSTGEDGALEITANTTLPVQEDGVHHYTTININAGRTLRFTNNPLNTPVVFLCSGDVVINGTIDLQGAAGRSVGDALAGLPGGESVPGPGGYPGGIGGASNPGFVSRGTSGGGPGGGEAANTDDLIGGRAAAGNGGSHFTLGDQGSGNPNVPSVTYGDPRLITLTGGSGGAGGNSYVNVSATNDGPGGGAGGGAILIASSGTITVNGTIDARGGNGHNGSSWSGGGTEGSGAGAGGTVRLIANSIGGTGSVRAYAATGGVDSGVGHIVLEALNYSGNLESNCNPPAISLPSITTAQLPSAEIPTIRITTINGTPVPEPPSGTMASPDVVIPNTETPPFTVEIETHNVPDGAIISLRTVTEVGDTLISISDPVLNNATTATITPTVGTGIIYATVEFNP